MGVLDDQNEEIRKSAYDGINTILLKYRDVAEKEINSILEYKKNIDEMRGLARPDTSRHLSDDIESSTVDTLVKSIADRYTISQKYYAFKAKLLGKEQLEYYEKSMPYGETKYEIKYEQAVDLVRKAFEGLDKKFVDIFDEFLAKGRIDVYPQVGKQ